MVPSQATSDRVRGWRERRAVTATPSIWGQVPHPFNPAVLGLDRTSEPPENFRCYRCLGPTSGDADLIVQGVARASAFKDPPGARG